jgi:hypothetical protein
VIEPQLTYKMTNHLSLALEYRYNGYEDANPAVKGSGAALGLEVSFKGEYLSFLTPLITCLGQGLGNKITNSPEFFPVNLLAYQNLPCFQ